MKKMLAVLTLFFTLSIATQAVALEDYYSGAWYDLRVAQFRVRGAGELRIWTYDNKTVIAEFWYNGAPTMSGTGTWANTRNLFNKSTIIVMQGGQILRGTLNTFSGFAAGSYKGGGDTGRWQAIVPP